MSPDADGVRRETGKSFVHRNVLLHGGLVRVETGNLYHKRRVDVGEAQKMLLTSGDIRGGVVVGRDGTVCLVSFQLASYMYAQCFQVWHTSQNRSIRQWISTRVGRQMFVCR